MTPKNVYCYTISSENSFDANHWNDQLSNYPERECSAQEEVAMGWAPCLPNSSMFCEKVDQFLFITLAIQKKDVKRAALDQQTNKKVKHREKEIGRKLSSYEKNTIREACRLEILEKTFPVKKHVSAFVDLRKHVIVINSSTASSADALVSRLRKALNLQGIVSMKEGGEVLLSLWNNPDNRPDCFSWGGEYELYLKDASVKFRNADLDGVIQECIDNDFRFKRASINIGERLTFVLSEDMGLKQIEYGEAVLEQLTLETDPRARAVAFAEAVSEAVSYLIHQRESMLSLDVTPLTFEKRA